jgi:hypothetical protein
MTDTVGQRVRQLRAAAADHGYEWVTSPFFLDLTLRKAG